MKVPSIQRMHGAYTTWHLAGALVLTAWLAGCDDGHYLAVGYRTPEGYGGNASGAAWYTNPVAFPQTITLSIAGVDPPDSEHDTDSIFLRSATVEVMKDSVCTLTGSPTCTDGACSAPMRIDDYGICLARVTGVTHDGEELRTCWHLAQFLGNEKMAEQEAAIYEASERCMEGDR